MKEYLLAALLLTTIITFVILARYISKAKVEGFEDDTSETKGNDKTDVNPLTSVMALIRRSGARLMDIDMWKERILMSSMSPIELARHYLKSQAKSGDAKEV
jgi:hypothetical protein